MNQQTEIVLDIETIPAQDSRVIEAIRADLRENFKAPSTLTKEKACADLGMTDAGEIKFTSKDRALELWVERFRDEKLEESAQEQYRRTSFDGSRGHIAVIGIAVGDRSPISTYQGDWQHPSSEPATIRAAFEYIADTYEPSSMRNPLFIGHNVAGFDLPFLFKRAVILGIKPPSIIPFGAKPWDESVFDTMRRWDAINPISLDALCTALGVQGKTEGMDGSQVWDYVRTGRIGEVAEYCLDDCDATRNAYRRMTFQPLHAYDLALEEAA